MRHKKSKANSSRIWWRLLILSLFSVCATLMAQLTLSTIRGTAADPSGAVITGAEITVINLQTNEKRTVKTNENGDFEIPDLYRGSYRLSATQAGFKTFVADNVLLEGQQVRRVNVAFEVGSVGTEVTVTAGARPPDRHLQDPGRPKYRQALRYALGGCGSHARSQPVHHHTTHDFADQRCLELAVGRPILEPGAGRAGRPGN